MKKSRRTFIQKLVAAGSGMIIAAKTGFATDNSETMTNEKTVKNIKPLGFQWETRDPFLFCVHHEDFFPKGNDKMGPNASLEGRNIGQDFMIKDGWRMYHGNTVPGFPGHPHRGFETITVVRKGYVDHTDSQGAAGRYGNGDVQWMTAGRGLQHAEMFPLLSKEKDNPMELFQIWLNLPRKSKMVDPHFKMLWADTIPKIEKDINGKNIFIELIAGRIEEKSAPTPPPNSWAADQQNEVAILNIKIEEGGVYTLPKAAAGVNRSIYFYKGNQLQADDTIIPNYHGADLKADAEITLKAIGKKAHMLILQGKPINEPVVQHGPFVMNSREEIQQAFYDYQRTQFGGWPWPTSGPVHPRTQGRFAHHADGRKEEKGFN